LYRQEKCGKYEGRNRKFNFPASFEKTKQMKARCCMKYGKRWSISAQKKQEYINKLLPQLAALRARAGLSQDELAGLVGVSRQTYCLTETGARSLSWNTYLSIVMFFDYNCRTHDLLRSSGAFPEDLFYQFNPGDEKVSKGSSFEAIPELNKLFFALDESGKNSVRGVVVCEYARCAELDKAELIRLLSELVTNGN